jgi:hypothetical protein
VTISTLVIYRGNISMRREAQDGEAARADLEIVERRARQEHAELVAECQDDKNVLVELPRAAAAVIARSIKP